MGYARVAERIGAASARLGIEPPQVPAPLLDSYYALMMARVVTTATSVGVFAALSSQPLDAGELARRTEIDERGARVLLAALHALGYVRHSGRGWSLSRRAARWLDPGAAHPLDGFVGAFVPHAWEHWFALDERLRGRARLGLHERDRDDPYWEHYQRAMLETARITGPAIARAIPVRSPRRLLDLAGGPGGHAMAMCRRHLGLEATVVELEGAARHGRRLVAAAGFGERISYVVGDLFEAQLGEGFDVATAHNIVHMFEPARNVELLRRARAALRPGGVMAVHDLEAPEEGTAGTEIATLLGVLFWLLTDTRTYSATEVKGWFQEAGFERVRVRRPRTMPGSMVVVGRAP